MILLINSLLVFLNGIFQFYLLSFLLTPKKKRLPNMLPYCLPLFITVLLKCAATNPIISVLFALCNTATLFCYAIFAFKNSFWEKIGKCVLLLGVFSVTTEAIYSVIQMYVLRITPSLDYYSETMVVPLLILNAFTIIFAALFLFIARLTQRIKRRRRFILITLLILVQLLAPTILFIIYASDILEENLYFSLISPIILFIANLFLVLYAMNQEEKTAANAAYRELQTLHQIEEAHYKELEQHSEALAKIRHDFNNQLATIHMLLQSKNYADAKEMALHMKELLDCVSS